MHVNPKPKPPLPGGEHTFTTDTGRQAVRPGIPVVNLIPVGDGRPGPLLPRLTKRKKRKPFLPNLEEIMELPRYARVAFAARCACRVLPVFRYAWSDAPEHYVLGLQKAMSVAQQAGIARVDRAALDVTRAAEIAAREVSAAAAAANACAYAADASAYESWPQLGGYVSTSANNAARAILLTSSDPRDLLFIRRDFDRVRRLAKVNGWTDDTPVAPEVFGPLWPDGRVPKWAQEASEPRG